MIVKKIEKKGEKNQTHSPIRPPRRREVARNLETPERTLISPSEMALRKGLTKKKLTQPLVSNFQGFLELEQKLFIKVNT